MMETILKLLDYINNSPHYKFIDLYIQEGNLSLHESIIRGLEHKIDYLEDIIENEISDDRLEYYSSSVSYV
jgi:hypothetical protein